MYLIDVESMKTQRNQIEIYYIFSKLLRNAFFIVWMTISDVWRICTTFGHFGFKEWNINLIRKPTTIQLEND